MHDSEYEKSLVKFAGLALLVAALLLLPKAIGSAIALSSHFFILLPSLAGETKAAQLIKDGFFKMSVPAIEQILSCGLLFFLSRWIFGFPPFLERAFRRTDKSMEKIRTERST